MTNAASQSGRQRQAPVYAVPCRDYASETIKTAFDSLFERTDALTSIRPETKVAIKVNLISAKAPETAATTHPELVCELCRRLIARGAFVTVGDSPGGLFTKEALEHVYKVCGMNRVEETGAKLNYDVSTEDVHFDQAVSARVFTCTSWLRKADVIIDFAKLKTHGMMKMTAAVKNMFGAVPGTTKPEYHMRFPDADAFANMLIDLNEYFHPALNLIDAADCMEGNGPTAGSPRHMGLLLASESPYDLDMVCADLIGLTASDVPTLQDAAGRGLGPDSAADVQVVGADLSAFRIRDFKTASEKSVTFFGDSVGGRIANAALIHAMQQIPKVQPSECISCGKCSHVCPAHAITMKGSEKKIPHIDRNRCIRCFCCQEFCPVGAMKVHRTAIARLLQRKEN
ncbi:MAG: DUF362 domain-containing protein [Lachnospiraceae bacterium]